MSWIVTNWWSITKWSITKWSKTNLEHDTIAVWNLACSWNVLGNVLPKEPTKDIVVFVKHWLSDYQTYGKKVPQIPFDALSIFSLHSKFACQTKTPLQKVGNRNSDSGELKLLLTHERKEQLDKISLWESLVEFCHGLDVTLVNKNDSIIFTEITKILPRMFFYWNLLKTMYHTLFYWKYQSLIKRSNEFICYLKSWKVFS